MFFLVYRGLGGLVAAISPFVVGLLLHWVLVTLILRHSFSVNDHWWSVGLSLFLGGLLTAVVLKKLSGNTQAPSHTQVATEEVEENGLPTTKQQESPPPPSAQPQFEFPTTADGLWRMASQPIGNDHVCFVAPNQIAAIYMGVGLVLVVMSLLDIVLTPVGGLLSAILWIILLGVAYFLKVMVCSDPIQTEKQHGTTASNGISHESSRQQQQQQRSIGKTK